MAVPFIAVIGLLVGATLGSFAGVVSTRGLRAALSGRSRCDACLRKLDWYELIPLVSFVMLRRQCRECGVHIRWSVYGWEVGGAVLGLATGLPIALTLTG